MSICCSFSKGSVQLAKINQNNMIPIFLEFAVKLLGLVLPSAIRWKYPAERIDRLIKVRVSSQGDGIEFWGDAPPRAKAYVEIINLSPFPLEIERAYGSFAYGADLEKFTYLRRESIQPGREILIPIETSMTKEQVDTIRRLIPSGPRPTLHFNAHILSKVHSFELRRAVESSHHRLVNFNVS